VGFKRPTVEVTQGHAAHRTPQQRALLSVAVFIVIMASAGKNAYGYCRVSTELVAQETSLDVQETRIRLYCEQHGHTLVRIYKESISGKDTKRAQLQRLLEDVKSGELVVVTDVSRLSRSTVDGLQLIERFQKQRVGFISISQQYDTTTPLGEVILTVQLSFNQYERKQTALKVSGAMQTLSTQGKLRGRPPFGWKFAGKVYAYATL
jgi:DNA invertase Pin-like site-specific DNA recombinase